MVDSRITVPARLMKDQPRSQVAALIVYQIGGLVAGAVSFNLWTVVALALLAAIICLLVRKGYQGEENTRRLTSVAAAAN